MKSVYLIGTVQVCGNNRTRGWRNRAISYFSRYGLDFECVSPVELYEYDEKRRKSGRETMRFDLRKVRESDVMLVNLKDIRQCVGACDEIFYAYMLGKPIIGFIEGDLSGDRLISYVHEWKYEQIDRIETGKDALEKACDYIIDQMGYPRNCFVESC